MKLSFKISVLVAASLAAVAGAGLLLASAGQTQEATSAATPANEWSVYAKIVIAYPKVKPTGEWETYAAGPKLGGSKSVLEGEVGRAWPIEGLDVTVPDDQFTAQLEAKDPNCTYVIAHSLRASTRKGEAFLGGSTGWQPAIQGPDWDYSYILTLRIEATEEKGWVKLGRECDCPFAFSTFVERDNQGTELGWTKGPPYLEIEGGTYGALDRGPGWGQTGIKGGPVETHITPSCRVLYAILPAGEGRAIVP